MKETMKNMTNMMNKHNRITATRIYLINWSVFQGEQPIKLCSSTLLAGANKSGKSTILDAMSYLLTGNTTFNPSSKDKDRTVKSYARGDTKRNGSRRFLRKGQVVSYVVMEFWSPIEEMYIVTGVTIESPDEVSNHTSNWFVCKNATLEDFNFVKIDGKKILTTPKSLLTFKGNKMKASEFMSRERGVEQISRALGLRCDMNKYRSKLVKMMAFNPEADVDKFISDCVLEPGKIDSLKELRQQKEHFEHLKQIYENLKEGKKKLEEIEDKISEYETKKKTLHIREMMLSYQELLIRVKEKEEIQNRILALEQKRTSLIKQKENIQILFEEALKRVRIAESNDSFQGMQNSIQNLENQIQLLEFSIKQDEEQVSKLLRLQKLLSTDLKWTLEKIDEESRKYLLHIAEEGYSTEKKQKELISFIDSIQSLQNFLGTEKVHCEDNIETLKQELVKLEQQLKILESNQIIYPEEVIKAKQIIKNEFNKNGIKADVRIFAELVQSIKDASWQKAIETFLGYKRFYIIVDKEYCHEAIKILREKKLHSVNVVITDKLPESEIVKGSAADQLVIPNINARQYANYLLNQIYLCDSLEELREHPRGGLTKDGMLAKSFSVACMNMKKTQLCLGQEAIKLQMKATVEQKEIVQKEYIGKLEFLTEINNKIKALRNIDLEISNYQLDAPVLLAENYTKNKALKEKIKNIKENPEFLAILQEQQDAKKAFNEVDQKRINISDNIAIIENELNREKENQKNISGEINKQQNLYNEIKLTHMELENEMIAEYNKLYDKRGEIKVISEKTVTKLKSEIETFVRNLEDLQLDYCKVSEIDIKKRGIAYIPFYHEEYRNIANVKIDEAHERIIEQSKKIQDAFMSDFVAEINETMKIAKSEIEEINRELKHLPFGGDTYKFKMEEKPERLLFFRICKKLENYMNSPEIYMNSNRDDEEMERDIQEFMNMILSEEDETEYTDYRKYFSYDMIITSNESGEEVTTDFSKKQGSASNGEKQTPYFIILAASLLQCYPKRNCCCRLAFIDEAFSALSGERIKQMVKYLENNNFQVIYAAPPEKIGSIGRLIDTTVSLVKSGDYTKAVEGLVKVDEFYDESDEFYKEAKENIEQLT